MRISNARKSELFKQFSPMTFAMARKFVRFGVPYRELVDEAQSGLALIIAKWNVQNAQGEWVSHPGNPSTWIYQKLWYHLMDYCRRGQPKERVFSTLEKRDGSPLTLPDRPGWFDQLCRNLGGDAKILVMTIVAAPADIADDVAPETRARARSAVRGYLTGQGWSAGRLEAAWQEVEACLAL